MSKSQSSTVLPDELIYEILVKLPVNTLLRWRCVCKSWKTLICSPQFVRDHHLHTSTSGTIMINQRLAFFINGNPYELLTCSVQSLVENLPTPAETVKFSHDYEIIGSYNGLLCLNGREGGGFTLWNPCTRLKSERSPHAFPGEKVKQSGFGFGYDKVNDKYKVLALVSVIEGLRVRTTARLYTFGGESSWTTIHEDLSLHPAAWWCSPFGQFASGNLHWLTTMVTDYGRLILSFDMVNETCGQMLLPPRLKADKLSLHGSGNCLYVCQKLETHWSLWLMKEYGVQDSWTKFTKIPLFRLTGCIHQFHPYIILENGVVLLKTKCFHFQLVLRYDSNNGTSPSWISPIQHGRNAWIYHESLVAPPCRLD